MRTLYRALFDAAELEEADAGIMFPPTYAQLVVEFEEEYGTRAEVVTDGPRGRVDGAWVRLWHPGGHRVLIGTDDGSSWWADVEELDGVARPPDLRAFSARADTVGMLRDRVDDIGSLGEDDPRLRAARELNRLGVRASVGRADTEEVLASVPGTDVPYLRVSRPAHGWAGTEHTVSVHTTERGDAWPVVVAALPHDSPEQRAAVVAGTAERLVAAPGYARGDTSTYESAAEAAAAADPVAAARARHAGFDAPVPVRPVTEAEAESRTWGPRRGRTLGDAAVELTDLLRGTPAEPAGDMRLVTDVERESVAAVSRQWVEWHTRDGARLFAASDRGGEAWTVSHSVPSEAFVPSHNRHPRERVVSAQHDFREVADLAVSSARAAHAPARSYTPGRWTEAAHAEPAGPSFG